MRVLVTGAASGLGAALTSAFRARGDEVLATDVTGADLTLDITSDEDWAAALEHVEGTWGGLDMLVNNAGVAGGGRLDVGGPLAALSEVSQIKVAVPNMAQQVIDMAMQLHGGAGLSDDLPLAGAWTAARALRLADGPDEVHRGVVARLELGKYGAAR